MSARVSRRGIGRRLALLSAIAIAVPVLACSTGADHPATTTQNDGSLTIALAYMAPSRLLDVPLVKEAADCYAESDAGENEQTVAGRTERIERCLDPDARRAYACLDMAPGEVVTPIEATDEVLGCVPEEYVDDVECMGALQEAASTRSPEEGYLGLDPPPCRHF